MIANETEYRNALNAIESCNEQMKMLEERMKPYGKYRWLQDINETSDEKELRYQYIENMLKEKLLDFRLKQMKFDRLKRIMRV